MAVDYLMYRSSYKTHAERKQRLIFFTIGGFYKTFESDAVFVSHLFGFQLSNQNGVRSTGFPVGSGDKNLALLKQGGYSYVVIHMQEGQIPNVIQYYLGNKSLELNIPIDMYIGLLDDLESIIKKYRNLTRNLCMIDLPNIEGNLSDFQPPILEEDAQMQPPLIQ